MVGVQGLSRRRRLHPCHVANAGVGRAHGVGKTLGGRAVGDIVPQALILTGIVPPVVSPYFGSRTIAVTTG